MAKQIQEGDGASESGAPTFFLKAVTLLCHGNKSLDALPRVPALINPFADDIHPLWTLETASKCGMSVRLLQRLEQQQWPGVSGSFRLSRIQFSLADVVARGDLALLHWWTKSYMPDALDYVASLVFSLAIEHQQLPVIKWLYEHSSFSDEKAMHIMSSRPCDSLEIARWLYEHLEGAKFPVRLHTQSGEIDFEFIKWAHAHQLLQQRHVYSFPMLTLAWMIRLGRLDELIWWHGNLKETCMPQSLDMIIECGRLQVTKWLYAHYPRFYFDDPVRGCRDMETVQWMISAYEWKHDHAITAWIQASIERAAAFGDQECVTFLLDVCPDVDCSSVISIAAQHGHLQVIQYFHGRLASSTTDAMDKAAHKGHLHIVQWLHGNHTEGCTTEAMDLAAAANYLEVVRWLHANRSEGCTTKAMDEAAANGYLEMVQWLHLHRSEGCTTKAMDGAAAAGLFEMVLWLREH